MSYSLSTQLKEYDKCGRFRNPQAETENQEDNVLLEEVAPKTAMEVEDNPDPAGSEVLTADENTTRSSSRRSKAVDNDVSAETQTAVETLNSTRSSRAASKVRQSS